MAGSYAREGDQTTGHGSYPPAIFLPLSSLCQKATIEGKPILTVDAYCGPHTSPSNGSPTLGGAPFNPLGGKIIQGSPTELDFKIGVINNYDNDRDRYMTAYQNAYKSLTKVPELSEWQT